MRLSQVTSALTVPIAAPIVVFRVTIAVLHPIGFLASSCGVRGCDGYANSVLARAHQVYMLVRLPFAHCVLKGCARFVEQLRTHYYVKCHLVKYQCFHSPPSLTALPVHLTILGCQQKVTCVVNGQRQTAIHTKKKII